MTFPADSAIANAVGWIGGAVPEAEVVLQRSGSSDPPDTARSDSAGAAHFSSALTGSYTVSGLRILDSTERARLPAMDADVDALGSGRTLTVDTPSTLASLQVPASHRGSLVVSEYWFPYTLTEPPKDVYPFGGFVELYNNADTTVYLDGLTFGDGLLKITTILPGSANSCTNFPDMMSDSTGVWAADIFRFPGSGHQYPVQPGGTVVLATDAIDHTVVNDSASDLSNASFEFFGSSDVDNPAVPNMINLGTWVTPLGHGWYPLIEAAPFVARALSPDTLANRVIYSTNIRYFHVARAAVLAFSLFDYIDPGYSECSPLVSPLFDAAPAIVPNTDFYAPSMKRKVLRYLPGGRAVLQNTRTSSRDFEFTFPRTPGAVP